MARDGIGPATDARDLGAFIPARLDDYGLSVVEFRVYCRIARRAGSTSTHSEGARQVAASIGVGERAVREALHVLREAGLVSRRRLGRDDHYTLTPDGSWCDPAELPRLRAEADRNRRAKASARGRDSGHTDRGQGDRGHQDREEAPQPRSPGPQSHDDRGQGDRMTAVKGTDKGSPGRVLPPSTSSQAGGAVGVAAPDEVDEHPAAISAGVLMAEHLAAYTAAGRPRPPKKVVPHTAAEVRALLDEGVDPDDIRGALAIQRAKGLHPSALPAAVEQHRARQAAGTPDDARAWAEEAWTLVIHAACGRTRPEELGDGPAADLARAWIAARGGVAKLRHAPDLRADRGARRHFATFADAHRRDAAAAGRLDHAGVPR